MNSERTENHPHELISARLDSALTSDESMLLETHLSACESCRRLAADLQRIVEALGVENVPPVPEGLAERIAGRARQAAMAAEGRRDEEEDEVTLDRNLALDRKTTLRRDSTLDPDGAASVPEAKWRTGRARRAERFDSRPTDRSGKAAPRLFRFLPSPWVLTAGTGLAAAAFLGVVLIKSGLPTRREAVEGGLAGRAQESGRADRQPTKEEQATSGLAPRDEAVEGGLVAGALGGAEGRPLSGETTKTAPSGNEANQEGKRQPEARPSEPGLYAQGEKQPSPPRTDRPAYRDRQLSKESGGDKTKTLEDRKNRGDVWDFDADEAKQLKSLGYLGAGRQKKAVVDDVAPSSGSEAAKGSIDTLAREAETRVGSEADRFAPAPPAEAPPPAPPAARARSEPPRTPAPSPGTTMGSKDSRANAEVPVAPAKPASSTDSAGAAGGTTVTGSPAVSPEPAPGESFSQLREAAKDEESKALMGGIHSAGLKPEKYPELSRLQSASKPITLDLTEASPRVVFDAIERASGISVAIADSVPSDLRITIHVENLPLAEILTRLSSAHGLVYQIPSPKRLIVTRADSSQPASPPK